MLVSPQSDLDIFYAVRFVLQAYKPDIWHGGTLVDFNDICSEFSTGWRKTAVRSYEAETWFWTLDCAHKLLPETAILYSKQIQLRGSQEV
jgi:hypothetical protein